MATQILMPALSPTMEEGTLAKWLVKEGDAVKSGQIIAVCNELTPVTRDALLDGTLDLVIDTPTSTLATKLVQFMIAACDESRAIPQQHLVPANLFISESL